MQGRLEGRRWTGLPVSWERWDPEQRAGWGTDIRVTGLFRVGVAGVDESGRLRREAGLKLSATAV